MVRYRVTWEERFPPTCKCCTEEAHPWVKHAEEFDNCKDAEQFADRLYDPMDTKVRRCVETQHALIPDVEVEWKPLWANPDPKAPEVESDG